MEADRISTAALKALEARALAWGYTSADEYLREHLGIIADGKPSKKRYKLNVALKTKHGRILHEDSLRYLRTYVKDQSVDLIFTSPPFCLLKKKEYGNEDADAYLAWFSEFAREFKRVLKPNGSLVIDVGGSWNKGVPSRNLYNFEMLSLLCRRFGFHLAQELYWWNPSRLPTPAEWVTVRKIRFKDAINTVWWLSPTPFPKANNQRAKWPYSGAQMKLIETGEYNDGVRPSGHHVKAGTFNHDNGGSIPPNLIAMPNTGSGSRYDEYCEAQGIKKHPARFPVGLPEMFIRMLTDPGDRVLDPFGGSCATGEAAERLGRRWTCCELEEDYILGAKGRFPIEKNGHLAKQSRFRGYTVPAPNQVAFDESLPLTPDGGATRR